MAASKSNHQAVIAALQARQDLDERQKRIQIRGVKAAAFKAVFPEFLEIDTQRGRATVTGFAERLDGFQCTITIPGVKLNNPFVFVNPPLLVADNDGDIERVSPADQVNPERRRKYREDPEAVLSLIVAEAVK